MRIAIYGAGSLGTILGAYLTKANLDTELINRNKAHVEALKKNGAKVVGKKNFTIPVKALLPEEMEGSYDIIFLMTKQLDNPIVVKNLKPFLGDDGIICTCQNGLPEPGIAEIIGKERTYGCAIAWGATLLSPGVSELTSDEISFSIGGFNGKNDRNLEKIASVLSRMGTCVIEENFLGARWSKLLINAAFSGLSTVTGCTFGQVSVNKKSRRVCQAIIKECIDVSKKAGYTLEPVQGKDIAKLFNYTNPIKKRISFALIPLAMKKHADLKASMLQDIEKGKPTEIDFINGIVCTYGRKTNVPTPANDMVVKIVKEISGKKRQASMENIELFNV